MHAAPIRPVIAAAPVTVDVARFERALAGTRPIAGGQRRHRAGLAPFGVLMDVARVEPATPLHEDETAQDRPGIVVGDLTHHRRASAAPRAGRAGGALTEAELSVPFGSLVHTVTEPASEAGLDRVVWTIEDGYVQPEPPPTRMRTVRHRPSAPGPDTSGVGRDADAGVPDPDEDIGDEHPPTLRFVPAHGPRGERPPADLVDVIARVTGVDVGDTEIDRSPGTSGAAASIGAVAFTELGTVYLPAELGSIDDPDVRAITAHELVHVAQQRRRNTDLPDESSAEGRALEAEASAVHHAVLGRSVSPTLMRRAGHQPLPAPRGIQRLAADDADDAGDETGWTGVDYTNEDLSDIEPGGPFDPFAWQERDGEPVDEPWELRRDWAERFETENAEQLQRRRDERYHQLVDDATAGDPDRAGRRRVASIRRRLDAEMPYQFGPPPTVEPYPRPLPTGTEVGDVIGAVVIGSLMSTVLAGFELRHVRAGARRDRAANSEWSDAAASDVDERRLDRELEVRRNLLEAKRARAEADGAPASHVVALTDDELERIRDAVDLEFPVDDADRRYLDDDQAMRLSVGGVLDAEPPAPRQGEYRTAPSAPADAGPARVTTSDGVTRAGQNDMARDDTLDEQAAAGRGALRDIAGAAMAAAPAADTDALRAEDRAARLAQRRRRARSMREYVLRAKVLAALGAGARPGTVVILSDAELASIRAALDVELPLGESDAVDEGDDHDDGSDDDAHTTYTITSADVAELGPAARRRDRGAAAADGEDDVPTPADVADEIGGFADFLPDGVADVVGAGFEAFGLAAAVPGALSTLFGVDVTGESGGEHSAGPHPAADDDVSAFVVESLSEIDLEILTRKLWRRLRRELRGELLIDRERAGVLADVR